MSTGRILSIQSHVAFGYVGGKAAVFPLQCLGYDVDVINTVNFSNHTGYGRFGGTRTNAEELSKIFHPMEENGLLRQDRLLTGYIPGGEALTAVKEMAERLRKSNPKLIYLLDPVLGDSGKLYVAPDTIPIYRSMLPLSTIITPNWFEVEVLTDTRITDMNSLRTALRILHEEHKVPNVVISSIPLKKWLLDVVPAQLQQTEAPDSEDGYLLCISSSYENRESGSKVLSTVHARAIPCIPGYFSGVGDLFSALVLAHYKPPSSTFVPQLSPSPSESPSSNENALSIAASHALSKTHAILSLTHEYAMNLPEDERLPTDEELDAKEPARKISRMRGRELRLVQGQDVIRGTKPCVYRKMEVWTDFWA
ncbi:Ribokinase-like protein [Panus rudis PR-1116 ss-1]|nr:Ribokinase-like protein [Panus rudis PR-1116 ss-1]